MPSHNEIDPHNPAVVRVVRLQNSITNHYNRSVAFSMSAEMHERAREERDRLSEELGLAKIGPRRRRQLDVLKGVLGKNNIPYWKTGNGTEVTSAIKGNDSDGHKLEPGVIIEVQEPTRSTA